MKILHRCDGGPGQLGMGHVMRNIALALELRARGHEVIFLVKEHDGAAVAALRKYGFLVNILPDEISEQDQVQKMCNADLLVIDLYPEFGGTEELYYYAHKEKLVLAFSDYALPFFLDVDVLLNPHAFAEKLEYRLPSNAVRLCGLRYLPLREEFRNSKLRKYAEVAGNVLVTFGGSDSNNCTAFVVDVLREFENLTVTIVLGPSYDQTREKELLNYVSASPFHASLQRNVDNMADLMSNADIAITNAGSTAYEMCAMGTPAIIVITEGNQHAVADGLVSVGAVECLGRFENLRRQDLAKTLTFLISSHDARKNLANHSRQMIDGYGVIRIADAIEHLGETR